jgi:activator of HSP90 ATPase
MVTKTLRQTVTFHATPTKVFDLLMDSRKHQALSGEPAHISKKVGAKFTARGSLVRGYNLAVKRGKKIVQAWRATSWPPDHYSVATFDLAKVRGGTRLHFTQIGVPSDRFDGLDRGWIETYWTPMKEKFDTGSIGYKTRPRSDSGKRERMRRRQVRSRLAKHAS